MSGAMLDSLKRILNGEIIGVCDRNDPVENENEA